jgi:hypothetical protein
MWWTYYSQRPTESAANPTSYPDHVRQSALIVALGNKVADLQATVNAKAAALKVIWSYFDISRYFAHSHDLISNFHITLAGLREGSPKSILQPLGRHHARVWNLVPMADRFHR